MTYFEDEYDLPEDVVWEEDYTGRPVEHPGGHEGVTHAVGCDGRLGLDCICEALWEAKYQREREEELEEEHQKYWT